MRHDRLNVVRINRTRTRKHEQRFMFNACARGLFRSHKHFLHSCTVQDKLPYFIEYYV